MSAKKILIVDDEKHIINVLTQTLEEFEDEGVEILSAVNGKEALEIIINDKPEFVFLDIMMPEMDGYQVCEKVKQELKMEDIFITMLTAKGQTPDRKKGLAVGADRYITKPFDPDEIFELVGKVLDMDL